MQLADVAILVQLEISQWAGTAADKSAAREIEQSKNAQAGVAKVRKELMPDFPELDQLHAYNGAFRVWFNERTLPYLGKARLKATVDVQEFVQEVGRRMNEGDQLADAVAIAYPDHLEKAEAKLGDLFERALYPNSGNIRSKFGYRFTPMPVPDNDDLRNIKGVPPEDVDKLVEQAKEGMRQQVAEAVRDVWERVYKVTNAMAEKLAVPAYEKGGIFRDTLITNIDELISLMPSLNVFGDPTLTDVQLELRSLAAIHPNTLRTDPVEREERAARAKKLADKIKGYL